jgi:2-phosphoglycerate kinase
VLLVSIGVGLFVAVGIAMIVARKSLADGQAIVLGGSVVPGCVIGEAVVMFLLAIAMIFAYRYGLFR